MQKGQEQQQQQGNDDDRMYDVMDNDDFFKENLYKRNSSHKTGDAHADSEAEAYSQVTLNFAKRAAHAATTARQLNDHDNNNFSDTQRDLRSTPTSGFTITAT